jgi:hypothetical protein
MKKHFVHSSLICFAVLACSHTSYADQVINDDLIVTSSECVGFDCVNNESFGFTTIKLKENNTRIEFNDTSDSGTVSDWLIKANESTSGGANYFGVTEIQSGDGNTDPVVFRIDSGAPELSLYVDNQGNLRLTSATARIINLADPVNDTDAANLQTVNTIISTKVAPEWLSSTSEAPATTSGTGSTAVGAGASAGSFDTAIGYQATVTADNSTAVGANATVQSANGVAIGADSVVESGAEGGTALGQNARVQSGASNSVALGKDSVASEPNTVSVGSPGNERRITNVAEGVNSTDAVNRRQLDAVSSRVNTNSANIRANRQNITENAEDIAQNRQDIIELQKDLDDAEAGIAAAASLVVITPSEPGKTTLNLEGATYSGNYGVGLSVAHRLNSAVLGDDLYLNAGISTSSGNALTRVGGSWEF